MNSEFFSLYASQLGQNGRLLRTSPLTMSVQTYVYRFIVANFLTIYYNVCVLLTFVFNYMKNPFGDPFALKLKLEPPSCLADPKYGTHKYIKVNVSIAFQ